MIIFNEGLPGAGKSYDAVSTHILPALKAGRHVYARLNGLNHYAIAQHLGMGEDEVRERLHLISSEEVHKLFVIVKGGEGDGDMQLPYLRRDSLVVIDEAHEFYVQAREQLPVDRENFFAKHRHFGLDILLISQWFKRMHSAVRGRVERKHLFRKLGFIQVFTRFNKLLGKPEPTPQYVCRQGIAVSPDKFSDLSSETRPYDPAVFLLYHGIQPGTGTPTLYSAGFQGLFSSRQKLFFVCILLVLGVSMSKAYSGYSDLTTDKTKPSQATQIASPKTENATHVQAAQPAVLATRGAATASIGATGVQSNAKEQPKYSMMVGHLVNLSSSARARLAGVYDSKNGREALIEWRGPGDHIFERMKMSDLRSMGWTVELSANESYAKLEAEGVTLLATMWPVEDSYGVSRRQNLRTRAN